jgi:hypothetical protein
MDADAMGDEAEVEIDNKSEEQQPSNLNQSAPMSDSLSRRRAGYYR